MNRHLLRREEGSALVTAVILIGVMAMLGLAVHAAADQQTKASGDSRVRESAFGVTEAALNAQIFQLSKKFPTAAPGPGTPAYPEACTPGAGAGDYCPDPNNFSGYSGDDYAATACNGATFNRFTTTVRDNQRVLDTTTPDPNDTVSNPYYSSAVINTATWPRYDVNKDGIVWVRSDGRAGCSTRSIVQQVRSGEVSIALPRNVVTANSFTTANRGNKVIVDTRGNASEAVPVSLRCVGFDNTRPTAFDSGCAGYEDGKGQVEPPTLNAPSGEPSPVLDGASLEAIKALAVSNGTYYAPGVCPPTLSGRVVWVETLAATCGVSTRANNPPLKPGLLVVGNGTFRIGGNDEFYGVIYMRNLQNSTGPVVTLAGTSSIIGAVHVDGRGSIDAGSSKANIVFDAAAADLGRGLGSAAGVPNTWRELRPGE
jgi:Tfp pilus assembly protein PilX